MNKWLWWGLFAAIYLAGWFFCGWLDKHLPMNDHREYDDE